MFTRGDKSADRSVARGEQKARAWRFGEQRLNVSLAPDVIHHDERGFSCDGGPVLVFAGEGRVVTGEVVTESFGDLAHLLDEVALPFFTGGDPDDSVGEGPLHHFVVSQRFCQYRFTDAAHARQRSEGNGLAVIFGKQRVAQSAQGLGPREIVGDARRSGEVANWRRAVAFRQNHRDIRTYIP